jgi:hypothetical protein
MPDDRTRGNDPMSLVPTTHTDMVHIDRTAVLKAIGLNPADPKAQAVVLVCEQFGFSPILKHVILIKDVVYVTRDGMLHAAHASGQFDGIEVVDETETDTHWTAKVSVYRKDMSRPITYSGRYSKTGSNKQYGPEMAIARAESMALRRAFAIAGIPARDEVFDPDTAEETGELADPDTRAAIKARLNEQSGGERAEFRRRFGHPDTLLTRDEDAAWTFIKDHERAPDVTPVLPAPDPFLTAPQTEPKVIGGAEAKRLHALAHRKPGPDDAPGEKALDDTTFRVLTFASSNGRTDSSALLEEREADTLRQAVLAARAGRFDSGYGEIVDRWVAWTEEKSAVPA